MPRHCSGLDSSSLMGAACLQSSSDEETSPLQLLKTSGEDGGRKESVAADTAKSHFKQLASVLH